MLRFRGPRGWRESRASGNAPVVWGFSAAKSSVASATIYNHAGYSLGVPHEDRVGVVAITWSHSLGSTISDVRFHIPDFATDPVGIAATAIQTVTVHSVIGRTAMYRADIPNGTVADVRVTMSGAINGPHACSLWHIYPSNPTPVDSGVHNSVNGGLLTISDIEVVVGGILIGHAAGGTTGDPYVFAFSGADGAGFVLAASEADIAGAITYSSHHVRTTEANVGGDVTADPSGTTQNFALIAVSFGPPA